MMTSETHPRKSAEATGELIEVDLRVPELAAALAWLWPGAGHLYQRRYAKGILFMVCVLGTFFFGLFLGEGKVVYASWNQSEKRWQYIFQLAVGAPALPALVQSYRMRHGEPLLFQAMRPPLDQDELAAWHTQLNSAFELGTLFTMIAGLLNVLAIYDAYAGPFVPEPDESSQKPPPKSAANSSKSSRKSNEESS